MALSIKTDEADRLARELSRLTGETMTEAVTKAMRERLERVRREQDEQGDVAERIRAFARSIAHRYDRRPVSKNEWDAAATRRRNSGCPIVAGGYRSSASAICPLRPCE